MPVSNSSNQQLLWEFTFSTKHCLISETKWERDLFRGGWGEYPSQDGGETQSPQNIINWHLPQAPESSPASEALQLIFADSGLDGKSIMLDLSKLLNEDPNLANQVRWSWRETGSTFPTNYFLNSNKKPFPTSWQAATTRLGYQSPRQQRLPCKFQSGRRWEKNIKRSVLVFSSSGELVCKRGNGHGRLLCPVCLLLWSRVVIRSLSSIHSGGISLLPHQDYFCFKQ